MHLISSEKYICFRHASNYILLILLFNIANHLDRTSPHVVLDATTSSISASFTIIQVYVYLMIQWEQSNDSFLSKTLECFEQEVYNHLLLINAVFQDSHIYQRLNTICRKLFKPFNHKVKAIHNTRVVLC